MNSKKFIETIKIVVRQSTFEGIKATLEKPSGRSRKGKLVELSDWYKNLSETDKINMLEVVKNSIDDSIFGMLCVLDGVRAIESDEDKGELILEFHKNGKSNRINNQNGMFLHDIYKIEE